MNSFKKIILEWLDALVFALVIIGVLFLVFWPIRIDGPSMKPLLNDGDRVIVSRLFSLLFPPDYGDIIIFNQYIDGEKTDIIKRVVALPNDTVDIKDGDVYINGKILYENYIYEPFTEGEINISLGKDEYFLLGDNRQMSNDSRDIGIIHKDNIIARVIMKIYPFSKIQLL